jgi:hypothetical protein
MINNSKSKLVKVGNIHIPQSKIFSDKPLSKKKEISNDSCCRNTKIFKLCDSKNDPLVKKRQEGLHLLRLKAARTNFVMLVVLFITNNWMTRRI